MALLVDILSAALILSGSVFVVIGAVGLARMPDVYTRMHAASVMETLGAGLLILGLLLQVGLSLIAFKLVVLLALFFFVNPVASHALAQAALHQGVQPILSDDRRGRLRERDAAAEVGAAHEPTREEA